MNEGILGNATGGFGFPKTYIITDSNGNELTGVYVESETIFTATDNDVREGMVYASDNGVSTGTKDIPAYRTNAGIELIAPSGSFSIVLPKYNQYDYTVFQCMITLANMDDFGNSVETNMISINDSVYEVNSTIKLSDVSKNINTQSIDLNINNNSENYYIIHYFTYRQEV
jgi:hypothetical protein